MAHRLIGALAAVSLTAALVQQNHFTHVRRSVSPAASPLSPLNRGGAVSSTPTGKADDGIVSKAVIQWYPGHIAKAERLLTDCLKKVDVVIELRDARIPCTTAHPSVDDWVGKQRPRIVVFCRKDQVPHEAVDEWRRHLSRQAAVEMTAEIEKREAKKKKKIAAQKKAAVEDDMEINDAAAKKPKSVKTSGRPIFWIDSRTGDGVREVKRAVLAAGAYVNERRARRGIRPRAVRAAIIGYPNVGKSALINQLVGKKRAKSENRPGVTKSLNWVRIGGDAANSDIELLDSPGIIPASMVDQESAIKLAICNDIGEASYDTERVASLLVDLVRRTHDQRPDYVRLAKFEERYGIDAGPTMTSEDYVIAVSEKFFHGDVFVGSRRILDDLRKGYLGKFVLDVPGLLPGDAEADLSTEGPSFDNDAGVAYYSSSADPATKNPWDLDFDDLDYSAGAEGGAGYEPRNRPERPPHVMIPKVAAEGEVADESRTKEGSFQNDQDTKKGPSIGPDDDQLETSTFDGW